MRGMPYIVLLSRLDAAAGFTLPVGLLSMRSGTLKFALFVTACLEVGRLV